MLARVERDLAATGERDVDYEVIARKAGLTPWHGELLLQLDRIATALEGLVPNAYTGKP